MVYIGIGLIVTYVQVLRFIKKYHHDHITPKPEWFWLVIGDILSNIVIWPANLAIIVYRIMNPKFNEFVIETTKQFYEDKES